MTLSYLCTTNGVEAPSVVAGPFEGDPDECAGQIQSAAQTFAGSDFDDDDALLFALTVRDSDPPEFNYVGFTYHFKAER